MGVSPLRSVAVNHLFGEKRKRNIWKAKWLYKYCLINILGNSNMQYWAVSSKALTLIAPRVMTHLTPEPEHTEYDQVFFCLLYYWQWMQIRVLRGSKYCIRRLRRTKPCCFSVTLSLPEAQVSHCLRYPLMYYCYLCVPLCTHTEIGLGYFLVSSDKQWSSNFSYRSYCIFILLVQLYFQYTECLDIFVHGLECPQGRNCSQKQTTHNIM